MFGKKQQEIETLIGAKTSILGEVTTQGTLRLDGEIDGDIRADWVIVGETGNVKGDINTRGAVIGGKVNGNIKSKESTEILETGEVYGDIYTIKLNISEGALFRGHSFMEKMDKGMARIILPLLGQGKKED